MKKLIAKIWCFLNDHDYHYFRTNHEHFFKPYNQAFFNPHFKCIRCEKVWKADWIIE